MMTYNRSPASCASAIQRGSDSKAVRNSNSLPGSELVENQVGR